MTSENSHLPGSIYTERLENAVYETQQWEVIPTGENYILYNAGAFSVLSIVLATTQTSEVSQVFQSSITDNSGLWELYPLYSYLRLLEYLLGE